MTPAELRAIILSSGLSNSEFARRIGLNPRHMRKLLAGEVAVTAGVEADILRLLGRDGSSGEAFPRDEWIVGEGPPPERREYVIHTAAPRFIARVVELDLLTGDPEPDEDPADTLTGIVYAADGALICEIRWFDAPPADATALRQLLDRAVAIVDNTDALLGG